MRIKITSLFIVSWILNLSCEKEDLRKPYLKPVDPVLEVSRFSRELLLDGKNVTGIYKRAELANETEIISYLKSASVTKDNLLFLPIAFETTSVIEKALLHLKGADNYWEIPVASVNNSVSLILGIPIQTLNGEFEVEYNLISSSGLPSQTVSTSVKVGSSINECKYGYFPGASGSDGLTVTTYEIPSGENGTGEITIYYETYSVPDRVDIRYGNEWVYSTGTLLSDNQAPPVKNCNNVTSGDGFLGTSGSYTLKYDTGKSRKIDIYVSGCLDGGTAWDVVASCPGTSVEDRWYDKLPDCPCEYDPKVIGSKTSEPSGTWVKISGGNLDYYHFGAANEIRWVPGDDSGIVEGQQCTYDSENLLITRGLGAGTPDRVSPKGVVGKLNHYISDVYPWENSISCIDYLNRWPPNTGNCNYDNPKNDILHIQNLIRNMYCSQVVKLFRTILEDLKGEEWSDLKSYFNNEMYLSDSDLLLLLERAYDKTKSDEIKEAIKNLKTV